MALSSHLLTFVRVVLCSLPALLALPACDSGVEDELKLKTIAQGCLIDSDCAFPLVCAFEVCHVQCKKSRDCDGGVRCVASDNPYKVCQLEDEVKCSSDHDCKGSLRCGPDGECRDACQTSASCVAEQLCVSGTCADEEELDESGQLTPAPGKEIGGVDTPCVYASDCAPGLLCRNQSCVPECREDVDCGEDETCVEGRCERDGNARRACVYNSECTERGESCVTGHCYCECVEKEDCPAWQRCDGCACIPEPDAPKSCRYNSDCTELGMTCLSEVCDCECKKEEDCASGQSCDGCNCVEKTCDPECPEDQVCEAGACKPVCTSGSYCAGDCADLQTDVRHCGDCDVECGGGQACQAGKCQDLALATSCWDLHARQPIVPSGVQWLDPDGPNQGQEKFAAYCDMTSDGGGWTLVLKADGTKPTFGYKQTIWEEATPFNPEAPELDRTEAKLDSYSRIPAGEIRLETFDGDNHGQLALTLGQTSLFQALHRQIAGTRDTLQTAVGRAKWQQLFPGRTLLGTGCNLEGLDAETLDASEGLAIGVRIGILSSTGSDCSAPESYFGIGGQVAPGSGCAVAPGPAVGGITACGAAGAFSAFGYVFVRELPRTCREVKLRNPAATSGAYVLDVDGSGPAPQVGAYCDMDFQGGGWTLFFVQPAASGSIEGTPIPQGNGYFSRAIVMQLAQQSEQVHLRTATKPDQESVTSIAGDYPIQNLRRGSLLNLGSKMSAPASAVTGWTGPRAATADYLWQGCREDELAGTYPSLYHACNNGGGLSVDAGHAGWGFLADVDFEAYVR